MPASTCQSMQDLYCQQLREVLGTHGPLTNLLCNLQKPGGRACSSVPLSITSPAYAVGDCSIFVHLQLTVLPTPGGSPDCIIVVEHQHLDTSSSIPAQFHVHGHSAANPAQASLSTSVHWPLLSIVLNSLPLAITVVSASGKTVFANQASWEANHALLLALSSQQSAGSGSDQQLGRMMGMSSVPKANVLGQAPMYAGHGSFQQFLDRLLAAEDSRDTLVQEALHSITVEGRAWTCVAKVAVAAHTVAQQADAGGAPGMHVSPLAMDSKQMTQLPAILEASDDVQSSAEHNTVGQYMPAGNGLSHNHTAAAQGLSAALPQWTQRASCSSIPEQQVASYAAAADHSRSIPMSLAWPAPGSEVGMVPVMQSVASAEGDRSSHSKSVEDAMMSSMPWVIQPASVLNSANMSTTAAAQPLLHEASPIGCGQISADPAGLGPACSISPRLLRNFSVGAGPTDVCRASSHTQQGRVQGEPRLVGSGSGTYPGSHMLQHASTQVEWLQQVGSTTGGSILTARLSANAAASTCGSPKAVAGGGMAVPQPRVHGSSTGRMHVLPRRTGTAEMLGFADRKLLMSAELAHSATRTLSMTMGRPLLDSYSPQGSISSGTGHVLRRFHKLASNSRHPLTQQHSTDSLPSPLVHRSNSTLAFNRVHRLPRRTASSQMGQSQGDARSMIHRPSFRSGPVASLQDAIPPLGPLHGRADSVVAQSLEGRASVQSLEQSESTMQLQMEPQQHPRMHASVLSMVHDGSTQLVPGLQPAHQQMLDVEAEQLTVDPVSMPAAAHGMFAEVAAMAIGKGTLSECVTAHVTTCTEDSGLGASLRQPQQQSSLQQPELNLVKVAGAVEVSARAPYGKHAQLQDEDHPDHSPCSPFTEVCYSTPPACETPKASMLGGPLAQTIILGLPNDFEEQEEVHGSALLADLIEPPQLDLTEPPQLLAAGAGSEYVSLQRPEPMLWQLPSLLVPGRGSDTGQAREPVRQPRLNRRSVDAYMTGASPSVIEADQVALSQPLPKLSLAAIRQFHHSKEQLSNSLLQMPLRGGSFGESMAGGLHVPRFGSATCVRVGSKTRVDFVAGRGTEAAMLSGLDRTESCRTSSAYIASSLHIKISPKVLDLLGNREKVAGESVRRIGPALSHRRGSLTGTSEASMHGPASAGRMGSPHSQHLLRAGLQTSADSGSQLAANNGNRTRPSSSARTPSLTAGTSLLDYGGVANDSCNLQHAMGPRTSSMPSSDVVRRHSSVTGAASPTARGPSTLDQPSARSVGHVTRAPSSLIRSTTSYNSLAQAAQGSTPSERDWHMRLQHGSMPDRVISERTTGGSHRQYSQMKAASARQSTVQAVTGSTERYDASRSDDEQHLMLLQNMDSASNVQASGEIGSMGNTQDGMSSSQHGGRAMSASQSAIGDDLLALQRTPAFAGPTSASLRLPIMPAGYSPERSSNPGKQVRVTSPGAPGTGQRHSSAGQQQVRPGSTGSGQEYQEHAPGFSFPAAFGLVEHSVLDINCKQPNTHQSDEQIQRATSCHEGSCALEQLPQGHSSDGGKECDSKLDGSAASGSMNLSQRQAEAQDQASALRHNTASSTLRQQQQSMDAHADLKGGELAAAAEEEVEEMVLRYNEIMLLPLTLPEDPSGGEPLVLVLQQDTTERALAEQRLYELTEAQLGMLEQLFPRHILEYISAATDPTQLAQALPGLARSHACVTVLFTDVVGFTDMSRTLEPSVVMSFMSELFAALDDLAEQHGVFKVGTAGDAYIVAGGLIARDENGFQVVDTNSRPEAAAQAVFDFAVDLLQVAQSFRMPHDGTALRMRVGLHSGPCMSGVVGAKMPKYTLYGDTINTASRMESTGKPCCIQVSKTTHVLLREVHWQPTGGVEVKGKGLMQTFIHEPVFDEREHMQQQDDPLTNGSEQLSTINETSSLTGYTSVQPALSVLGASMQGGILSRSTTASARVSPIGPSESTLHALLSADSDGLAAAHAEANSAVQGNGSVASPSSQIRAPSIYTTPAASSLLWQVLQHATGSMSGRPASRAPAALPLLTVHPDINSSSAPSPGLSHTRTHVSGQGLGSAGIGVRHASRASPISSRAVSGPLGTNPPMQVQLPARQVARSTSMHVRDAQQVQQARAGVMPAWHVAAGGSAPCHRTPLGGEARESPEKTISSGGGAAATHPCHVQGALAGATSKLDAPGLSYPGSRQEPVLKDSLSSSNDALSSRGQEEVAGKEHGSGLHDTLPDDVGLSTMALMHAVAPAAPTGQSCMLRRGHPASSPAAMPDHLGSF